MASKKHVVVVGGGGSGAHVVRALSSQLDSSNYKLTLINAHPYFVFYVASLRAIVTQEGSLEKRIFIPYDKLFVNGNGTFKQGVVTTIIPQKGPGAGGEIFLEDGESIDYDVLVLSPGCKWEAFLDIPYDEGKAQEHVQEWRNKFKNAKSIVIAGGGPVGIELAGELRHYYPDTKVTIVHGDNKLLNKAYPDKFRDDVGRRLRAAGANLILDDFVDTFPASITRKGTSLDADLVVPASGGRPNTLWIAASLGQDVVNNRGYVRIKPTLQLPTYPNIFALGDIIDFTEQKQLGKYGAHASVVAANVISYLNGTPLKKEYKGQPETIVLTMGKTRGAVYIGILWGLMFGNWLASTIKSKNLFLNTQWKALGYTA